VSAPLIFFFNSPELSRGVKAYSGKVRSLLRGLPADQLTKQEGGDLFINKGIMLQEALEKEGFSQASSGASLGKWKSGKKGRTSGGKTVKGLLKAGQKEGVHGVGMTGALLQSGACTQMY